MSAPKWGIFMNKVYADKKLGYGKIKEFEKPAELSNDPIYADPTMERLFRDGDSTTLDQGNGDAEDFGTPPADKDIKVDDNIKIESEIPNSKPDTSTSAATPKQPGGKEKDTRPPPPAVKPADDKAKKAAVKPVVKPKPLNDY